MASHPPVPASPRVISPSPTPSEATGKEDYFPPQTRSKASATTKSIAQQDSHSEEHPDLTRARSRSRGAAGRSSLNPITAMKSVVTDTADTTATVTVNSPTQRKSKTTSSQSKGTAPQSNGFLSPESAYPKGSGPGTSYWRNLSRSPSPLGLIPIHRQWRAFIHKHEVPRKALHVSIGFLTLWIYYRGAQTSDIHPVLLSLLIPIFTIDLVRFRWSAFNDLYIRVMGAFMRESEAHDRFNGVISYLAGLWATMYFCSKDVAVMSVLLLSWCDTAASTFGRMWGKYTPRIRRGKSLAGSLAACVFGIASALLFWGLFGKIVPAEWNSGVHSFAFQGKLSLPSQLRDVVGLSQAQSTVTGWIAFAIVSVASGIIVSVSEAVDIYDLDDNLTIPVLSGIGLELFLRVFGGSS